MALRVGLTYGFEKKAVAYRAALRDAGLEPVDLTPAMAVTTLDGVRGLVLSGGSDIEPRRYGQDNVAALSPHVERDEMELRLAADAVRQGLPVLAICRGMQLLNVVRGGTLHQDIGQTHQHVMHEVRMDAGSHLAGILGKSAEVNSRHHQAVDVLGEGLRVTARSGDGTVEGIELTGATWVVGVQWHPEDLADRRLFDAFRAVLQDGKP